MSAKEWSFLPRKPFSIESLRLLVIILTIIQIVTVGAIVFIHLPFFSYDESNTIRIASQSVGNIFHLLSLEPNFLIFYVVLHFVISAGVSMNVVVRCLFLLWLLSVFIFYKTIKQFKFSQTLTIISVYAYTLCSAFWYYAFYLRMYIFVILLNLSVIWILRLNSYKKIYLLYIVIFLATMLHPGQVLLGIILGTTFLTTRQFKKEGLILMGISVITFILNISFKANFLHQVQIGTEYLNNVVPQFGTFLNGLLELSMDEQGSTWVIAILIIYMLYKNWRSLFEGNLISRYLTISVSIAVFINFVSFLTKHAFAGRYFFELGIPLLFWFFTVIHKSQGKEKILLPLALFVMLTLQNYKMAAGSIALESDARTFCESVNNLQHIPVVTDLYTYNPLQYCLNQNIQHVIVLQRTGVYDADKLGDFDILREQAILGGSLSPWYKVPFANFLNEHRNLSQSLRQDIQKELGNSSSFYYIINISPVHFLSSQELELFYPWKVTSYEYPSIYKFEK